MQFRFYRPLFARARVIAAATFLALLTAPGLRGQVVSVPDANAGVGRANLVPLGSNSVQDLRTQILVPATYLPKTGLKVTDLAFASAGVGDYRFSSIEIYLGHLDAARSGKLSATFADNSKDRRLVLRKGASWRYLWPKIDAWHRIGLTSSFKHDGVRDLVVEVIVRGTAFNGTGPGPRRSSVLPTVYALDAAARSGFGPFSSGAKLQLILSNDAQTYVGTGCPASNRKAPLLSFDTPPALGSSNKAVLTDLASGARAALFFGTSDTSYGAIKLPFELKSLGAAACWLRTDVLLVFPNVANAQGRCDFTLTFPNESRFRGATITTQGLVFDSRANTLGLALSRLAKARL